jgi:hypothetical protein
MKHLQFWHGSWRVTQPVPKALQAIIGRGAYLTESLRTPDPREAERRALPVLLKHQGILDAAQTKLDQQQQRKRAFGEVAALNDMPVEELIVDPAAGTATLARFLKVIGVEEPVGQIPALPVNFEAMIEGWAQFGNKGKKAVQDTRTKVGAFIAWLEHHNMAAVTFEDGRDWRRKAISGSNEIKFDGYRMHARLDRGAVKLLTRTGLD